MAIHIIIDGYNLIRQSKTLRILDQQDIQLGRDGLVDVLAAYKKIKSHRITVVFDGGKFPLFTPQRHRQRGISIIFSQGGESADTLIKKMARKEREKALVVSSDQDIIRSAATHGAATIDAGDFETKLSMALYTETMEVDEGDREGWNPTTKKKGPSRRASKRKRRNRAKIQKL